LYTLPAVGVNAPVAATDATMFEMLAGTQQPSLNMMKALALRLEMAVLMAPNCRIHLHIGAGHDDQVVCATAGCRERCRADAAGGLQTAHVRDGCARCRNSFFRFVYASRSASGCVGSLVCRKSTFCAAAGLHASAKASKVAQAAARRARRCRARGRMDER
jgi:hypothetical protein